MSFINEARKLLSENIRDYGMFVALFVIMGVFAITTDGLFISSRNIVNLVNQTGYIAVLAVGMTLVIVIRHIDLSVGFLAGFLGAIVAIAMVSWELPVFVEMLRDPPKSMDSHSIQPSCPAAVTSPSSPSTCR